MFGILHKTKEGYYMLFDENKKWIGVMGDCDGKKLKLSKENCDEIFGVVDVEIEMEYKDIDELRVDKGSFLKLNDIYKPKLDADGCLILKKKL
jgi:hypothetical protein